MGVGGILFATVDMSKLLAGRGRFINSGSKGLIFSWSLSFMTKVKPQVQFLFNGIECKCLTHCILNRVSHTIYWKSPISILGTPGSEIYKFLRKMAKLFANSEGSDRTRRLIWVCTDYQLPVYGSPDYNGLRSEGEARISSIILALNILSKG